MLRFTATMSAVEGRFASSHGGARGRGHWLQPAETRSPQPSSACLRDWRHEQGNGKRPALLFKPKLTANVEKAIAKIPWDDWQGKPNVGLVQIAEITLRLNGWCCVRRVIVERMLKPLNPTPQGSFWKQC